MLAITVPSILDLCELVGIIGVTAAFLLFIIIAFEYVERLELQAMYKAHVRMCQREGREVMKFELWKEKHEAEK